MINPVTEQMTKYFLYQALIKTKNSNKLEKNLILGIIVNANIWAKIDKDYKKNCQKIKMIKTKINLQEIVMIKRTT